MRFHKLRPLLYSAKCRFGAPTVGSESRCQLMGPPGLLPGLGPRKTSHALSAPNQYRGRISSPLDACAGPAPSRAPAVPRSISRADGTTTSRLGAWSTGRTERAHVANSVLRQYVGEPFPYSARRYGGLPSADRFGPHTVRLNRMRVPSLRKRRSTRFRSAQVSRLRSFCRRRAERIAHLKSATRVVNGLDTGGAGEPDSKLSNHNSVNSGMAQRRLSPASSWLWRCAGQSRRKRRPLT
jgi:hypothetical protein